MKNIVILFYYGIVFFEILFVIRLLMEIISRYNQITGFFGIIYRNVCRLTEFIVSFVRKNIPARIGRMDFTYIMILLSLEILKNGIRLFGRI